jgi:outer membrane immunogenic protein
MQMGELMRSFTLAAVAAAGIALGAVQPASAADIQRPIYKAAPVIAAYNWSGFYVGGNIGWGWGEVDSNNIAGFAVTSKPEGFFGGGQVGFNWQAPGSPWVWGVEVDSQWANIEEDVTGVAGAVVANAFTDLNYFGTARLRLGYAWDRVMAYATGGLAWGNNEIGASVAVPGFFAGATSSATHIGWTVGAGVEWALLDNWSAKVEYLYLDLGNQDYFGGPGVLGGFDADVTAHTVKVGLNYRFGYGKTPVVAKY